MKEVPPFVKFLLPLRCGTVFDVKRAFKAAINKGLEGIIIRNDGPYKQGRSTRKQGYMLKMKEFEDFEAKIIGYREKMHNENPQTKDETGYAKRSSHKANKSHTGLLGALHVVDKRGRKFWISAASGHTQSQLIDMWAVRKELLGQIATGKSQVQGEKDLPRSPILKGIRKD